MEKKDKKKVHTKKKKKKVFLKTSNGIQAFILIEWKKANDAGLSVYYLSTGLSSEGLKE